jgi:transposase
MHDDSFGVGLDAQVPDALWAQMVRVIPHPAPTQQDGRPRRDDRQAMTAILDVLRTGCQWTALPRSLGAPSTVQDRLQAWRPAQVLERRWQGGWLPDAALKGLAREWQAMDGAMTAAPLGGDTGGQAPHRSRHARDHTACADGGARDAAWGRRRQSPCPATGRRHLGGPPAHAPRTHGEVAAASVCGQRVCRRRGARDVGGVGVDGPHPATPGGEPGQACDAGFPRAPLGGGADARLDAPLSAGAHPVGETGGDLSRAGACRVCLDHLSSR